MEFFAIPTSSSSKISLKSGKLVTRRWLVVDMFNGSALSEAWVCYLSCPCFFLGGVKHHPIFRGLKSFRRKQEPPDCWIRGVISSYTHLQPTSRRVDWDEKSHLQPGISALYWHNILPSLFFQR